MDRLAFRRLVDACGAPMPATLFSSDRYVLQMPVRAADAASALSSAIARWQAALRRSGVARWELVRGEVLTSDEFARELDGVEGDPLAQAVPCPSHDRIDAVEDELLRRALFDPVTGLPHRELFLEEVRRQLADGAMARAVRALLVVQVRGLAALEPNRGHPSPDDVLVDVAGRLSDSVRGADTVARVGPAAFAVLAAVPTDADADPLARRMLHNVRWRLQDYGSTPLVASMGLATTTRVCDADDLIQTAELAMVAAADQWGRNRHRRFADDPGAH